MTQVESLAKEIVGVLKYNPELTDDIKVLSVHTKLASLVNKIKDEMERVREDNRIIVDTRPFDVPVIAELMLDSQKARKVLLN